jgi:hypothetical protein
VVLFQPSYICIAFTFDDTIRHNITTSNLAE